MSDTGGWSHGYPVNELYPPSWHSFQSPAHLRAICALMGVAWEVDAQTPLSIAEVGCGTGYSAHMLAAGNPHWQVLGLDYNPAHIAEARSMTAAARLNNLSFLEADLAGLGDAELDRLPEFDLITVHGVWSWVADPVREGVLRLLQRRLKAGGLALISYNAMPGAAGGLGLARLVRQTLLQAPHSADGIAMARDLVQRLIAAEAVHLAPSTWRRTLTGEIADVRPGYLLHEFMTEHWRPSFHADVAAAMATARCDYVGSATIDENFPQLSLTVPQRELWDLAPDSAARELIFDLSVPRAFRRDLYVRGLRRAPRDVLVNKMWLTSATQLEGDVVLRTQAGEAQLPKPLINTVRAALKEGPRTVAELRALPNCDSATPAELLGLLIGSDCALPLWRHPDSTPSWSEAAASARRFNAEVARRLAPHGIGPSHLGLATPALGGGLRASAMELALAQLIADATAPADAATLARRLLPTGPSEPSVPSPGREVMDELERCAARVLSEKLPVWRALGIV